MRFVFLFILLSLLSQAAPTAKTIQQLDSMLLDPRGPFSGIVVLVENNQVVFEKSYGQVNPQKKLTANLDTLFDIGSVTKNFTAAAILLLEQQGKLTTNDSISKFFKVRKDQEAVKIIDLLHHRSGIKDIDLQAYVYMQEVADGKPLSPASKKYVQIQAAAEKAWKDHGIQAYYEVLIQSAPFDAKVNLEHKYFNFGYAILARIVEIASQSDFNSFVRKNFFNKLAMNRSSFEGEVKSTEANRALGLYQNKPMALAGDVPHGPKLTGASGIVTSAADLIKWSSLFYRPSVLTNTSLFKWIYPFPDQNLYALGWYAQLDIKPPHNIESVYHSGSNYGFTSQVRIGMTRQRMLIILSNKYEDAAYLDAIETLLW